MAGNILLRTSFSGCFDVCAISPKILQQSNRAQIKQFQLHKAGHCKNLSGLTHKICSKLLQKVRPVTFIKNIFLKTFEGQLFSERLKDIFLVAYLSMFSRFSRTTTHFVITVKKNITSNKLYVLKLPCENFFFKTRFKFA